MKSSQPPGNMLAQGGGDRGKAPEPEIRIIEPLCAVFRRKLKSEGLKYTPERAHVLDTILQFDAIFDAERLIDELKTTGIRVSKATVYRTIKLLQEAGIIQRVLFDEDQAHYLLIYGKKPRDLLIRTDTREVIAVDVPELVELRERLSRAHGLKAQGHRLLIFAAAD